MGSGRGPARSAQSQEKPTMRAPGGPPRAAAADGLSLFPTCSGDRLPGVVFLCLSGLGI